MINDISSIEFSFSKTNPESSFRINQVVLSEENGFPFNLNIYSFDIVGNEEIKGKKIRQLKEKYQNKQRKKKGDFNMGLVYESLFPENIEREKVAKILSEIEKDLERPINAKIINKFLNKKDRSLTLEEALELSSIFNGVVGKIKAKVMEETQGRLSPSRESDLPFDLSFEEKGESLLIKVQGINFQELGSVFDIPLKNYKYLSEITKFGFGPFVEIINHLLQNN